METGELFNQLEDTILNKGISIEIMLRAMIKLYNKNDLILAYMMKSLDYATEIVDTFKRIQEEYYGD